MTVHEKRRWSELDWCVTHNAESVENHGGSSDECWRVVWADTYSPEGTGVPYDLCRMVQASLLQEES